MRHDTESYTRVIQSNPKLPAAYNNLGLLYTHHLHRDADAEKAFRTALELKPAYSSAHCNLALLLAVKYQKVCDYTSIEDGARPCNA